MRRKLSSKRQIILTFIKEFIEGHSLPPTVREIQRACGISSTSVVDYNLRILHREGYISRRPDIARGIELSQERPARLTMSRIPVIGYIAAGEPLPVMSSEGWAQAEPLEDVEIPASLARPGRKLYALRVRGISMIDALIDDGDIVIIEPGIQAENGDMVVAWLKLEKEATLKRIYIEENRVRLQPANILMQPIYTKVDNLEIQGRVVSVLRNLR